MLEIYMLYRCYLRYTPYSVIYMQQTIHSTCTCKNYYCIYATPIIVCGVYNNEIIDLWRDFLSGKNEKCIQPHKTTHARSQYDSGSISKFGFSGTKSCQVYHCS